MTDLDAFLARREHLLEDLMFSDRDAHTIWSEPLSLSIQIVPMSRQEPSKMPFADLEARHLRG